METSLKKFTKPTIPLNKDFCLTFYNRNKIKSVLGIKLSLLHNTHYEKVVSTNICFSNRTQL